MHVSVKQYIIFVNRWRLEMGRTLLYLTKKTLEKVTPVSLKITVSVFIYECIIRPE